MKILSYSVEYYEVKKYEAKYKVKVREESRGWWDWLIDNEIDNEKVGDYEVREERYYHLFRKLESLVETETETSKALDALFERSQKFIGVMRAGGFYTGGFYIGTYPHAQLLSSYEKPQHLARLDGLKPPTYIKLLDGEKEDASHYFASSYILSGWEEWLFKDKVYYIFNKKEDYDDERTALLLLEHIEKERKKIEKLKKLKEELDLAGVDTKKEDYRRIPEAVRNNVWRRDGGKCVKCHSREKLEYDHIVPLSKGGSNTARNIELLCEKCNREKSANIG